jgi:glycerol-3-phosphate dehydrogenase (NAD(P)+)
MEQLVSIVGGGQMGLVMADALVAQGHAVRLWSRLEDGADELASTRQTGLLPEFRLHETVEVVWDDKRALDGASIIVCAIPTQFIRAVFTRLRWDASRRAIVVSVSKGIEIETLLRPTQIIAEVLGDVQEYPSHPMCALSGPTIAAELAQRLPAAMVAASIDESVAERVQDMFSAPWLRIYRHHDLIGVEMAGATKNIIALAAGMIDGLGIGSNAKSALLARGLAEIARLGAALGATVETFFGIAGVGDLATTCFSPFGRNRTCGERLGRGEKLEDVIASMNHVVEGVPTTKAVMKLARKSGVDMPITAAVHAILFESLEPARAIEKLMTREPRPEGIH